MDRLATLDAFIRVVESGSFSSAARQLRTGQPAVSKAIAGLEKRLGVQLLLRSTHKLAPTEAGQNFYAHAKRAMEEADAADNAARAASQTLSGRLRVGAAITFARLHIVPRLAEFLEANPKLDIDVVLDDRNIDLIEGGIDVALRMGDLPNSRLTARKIGQAPRVVVGTPAYFERAGIPRSPTELMAHEAVIYEQRGGGSTWIFGQGTAESAVSLKGRVRVNAAEGVREAVLAGIGLTVASRWMFAPELRTGAVSVVLPEWSLPPIDLWAVFPTGRRPSAKVRAFVAFVEKVLRPEPGLHRPEDRSPR